MHVSVHYELPPQEPFLVDADHLRTEAIQWLEFSDGRGSGGLSVAESIGSSGSGH